MSESARKLVGTLLMIVLLIVYPLGATGVYVTWLETSPWWLAVLYSAVAGLLWAVPAAVIIRWMVRPR